MANLYLKLDVRVAQWAYHLVHSRTAVVWAVVAFVGYVLLVFVAAVGAQRAI